MRGRCKPCGYTWAWDGTKTDLGVAVCPNCGGTLTKTTKPPQTKASRDQVGLDDPSAM